MCGGGFDRSSDANGPLDFAWALVRALSWQSADPIVLVIAHAK